MPVPTFYFCLQNTSVTLCSRHCDVKKTKRIIPWAHSTETYHKSTGYHGACATGARGVIRSFFINKKGSAATRTQLILFGSCADKGPFFCFLLPTCFFNVQTWIEWFVFVVEFFFNFYVFLTDFHPSANSISLVTLHSLLQSPLQHVYVCETV